MRLHARRSLCEHKAVHIRRGCSLNPVHAQANDAGGDPDARHAPGGEGLRHVGLGDRAGLAGGGALRQEAELAVGVVPPGVDLPRASYCQRVACRRNHLYNLHFVLLGERLAQRRVWHLEALCGIALSNAQLALDVAPEDPDLRAALRHDDRVPGAAGQGAHPRALELAHDLRRRLVVDAREPQLAVGVGAPGQHRAALRGGQRVVVARGQEPHALRLQRALEERGLGDALGLAASGAELAVAVVAHGVEAALVRDQEAVAGPHADLPDGHLVRGPQEQRRRLPDLRPVAQGAAGRGAEGEDLASAGEHQRVRLARS
mmetsp:Transcript_60763/g.177520  ORF Transcript_60763/g.177520 Transcript_60763/m.177520 type:complete len:317 (+) Transcript_60763:45-995(+)